MFRSNDSPQQGNVTCRSQTGHEMQNRMTRSEIDVTSAVAWTRETDGREGYVITLGSLRYGFGLDLRKISNYKKQVQQPESEPHRSDRKQTQREEDQAG
jgi:hypothetical protein